MSMNFIRHGMSPVLMIYLLVDLRFARLKWGHGRVAPGQRKERLMSLSWKRKIRSIRLSSK